MRAVINSINLNNRVATLKKAFFILLAALFFSSPIFATNPLLYDSIKSFGTVEGESSGSSLTAYAKGVDSLFYNPAGFSARGAEYKYQSLDQNETSLKNSFGHFLYLSPFGLGYWRQEDYSGNRVNNISFSYGSQVVSHE